MTNAIIVTVVLAATALFDYSLKLGQFQGLVFGLYTTYGVILQILTNCALGFWKKEKQYYIVAGTLAIALILVAAGLEIAG